MIRKQETGNRKQEKESRIQNSEFRRQRKKFFIFILDSGFWILNSLLCFLFPVFLAIGCIGCGEDRYYSKELGLEVKKIDPDLNGRWSLQGVVVTKIDSNSPALAAGLEAGDLISYLIGERLVKDKGDFKAATKEALKKDGKAIFKLKEGQVEVAVRKPGDSLKLKVEGNTVISVESGGPAFNAGLKPGDVIISVIDEKLVSDPKEFRKAVKKISKYDSKLKVKTADLSVVKLAAVDALGKLNDLRALEPLMSAAESDDRWLRQRAFKALENLSRNLQLQDSKLIELMVKHLRPSDEPDGEIRRSSAAILGQLKNERAVEPLVESLSDPVPGVRFIAGSSLAKIGEPAVKALTEALKSQEPNVREVAAAALGNIGGSEASKALVKAVDDEKISVKLTVLDALAKVGDAESVKTLKQVAQTSDSNLKNFVELLLSKLMVDS
jgi:HEAT repeat protein